MRLTEAWLLSAMLSMGCSVAAVESASGPAPQRNQCTSDSECGGGVCQNKMCVATAGQFGTVLVEVTPPASSGSGLAGIQFLRTMQLPVRGSGSLDLSLDLASTVSGTVTPDAGTTSAEAQCSYKLTFTPTEQLLGLSAASYTVSTDQSKFSLGVPPGNYDIYLQPSPLAAGDNCDVPPTLLLDQQVQSGEVQLPILLNAPQKLEVEVESVQNLNDWSLDVLDPITGDVLSWPVRLDKPFVCGDHLVCYDTLLDFSTVVNGDTRVAGHELVRLSPPDGVAAPTVLMDRSALELSSNATAVVDLLTSLPPAVTLEGRVEVGTSSVPARASVTLVATQLHGMPAGTLASYVRTIETDPEGRFGAKLLPGQYRVYAIPDAASFATSEDTWDVSATPSVQAGKVIGLSPAAQLSGSVFSPSGDPLVGASVVATAAPAKLESMGVLNAALGDASPLPRASSDLINGQGQFRLSADPGVFNVSVRSPDGTGFAWLVNPSVAVTSGSKQLGRLTAPLPVAYHGSVTVGDQAKVPGALIRAYIYVDHSGSYTSNPDQAASVLQVAETRASSDGTFTLLLPDHLSTR